MTKTILIVEKNKEIAEKNKSIIEHAGFKAITAWTAEKALAIINSKNRPDLVVTEVILEKEDSGFVLSYKIKSNPETAHIPVLILTDVNNLGVDYNFDLKTDEARTWLKADRFYNKPIRPVDFIARIRKRLGMSASEQAH
jgi:CheY-like chemotaxis protein